VKLKKTKQKYKYLHANTTPKKEFNNIVYRKGVFEQGTSNKKDSTLAFPYPILSHVHK